MKIRVLVDGMVREFIQFFQIRYLSQITILKNCEDARFHFKTPWKGSLVDCVPLAFNNIDALDFLFIFSSQVNMVKDDDKE